MAATAEDAPRIPIPEQDITRIFDFEIEAASQSESEQHGEDSSGDDSSGGDSGSGDSSNSGDGDDEICVLATRMYAVETSLDSLSSTIMSGLTLCMVINSMFALGALFVVFKTM
jgi:hypothetical protein